MQTTIELIPNWLKSGDFIHSLLELGTAPDEEIFIPKSFTFDLHINGWMDVFHLIDTCLFFGIDKLPRELYDYCIENPSIIYQFQKANENPDFVYQHITTIPEYQACQLCCNTAYNLDILLVDSIKLRNIPCVRYCIEDLQCVATIAHFRTAVYSGSIPICEYLIQRYPDWLPSIRWSSGIYNPLIEYEPRDMYMVRYLHEKIGIIWNSSLIIKALIHHNIEFAEYVIKNGCPIPDYAIDYAIRANSLPILEQMAEKGTKMDSTFSLNYAIQFDLIDIARFLYDHGAQFNEHSIICAGNSEQMREFVLTSTK